MDTLENIPRMVCIVSLGGPKNFVDTEIAAGSLLCRGLGITADEDEADIMLINTCAFIDTARKESVDVIKGAIRWKKRREGRRIVVAGCLVQWKNAAQVREKFPEVDLWTGIDSVERMGDMLADLDNSAAPAVAAQPCYIYNLKTSRVLLTPAHYGYLIIADGCVNRCSYCSIPNIRGSLRSRSTESVLAEAQNLVDNGTKELIIIAQDTTAFRRDKGETEAAAKLIQGHDKLKGDYWFRLMYLHPASVTDAIIGAMADAEHMVRCVEMPLQHISDRILLSMGRKVGEAATREAVRKVREQAHCAFRSTFMTGFPGETKEDFEKLLQYVEEQKFERLGAFYYSPEDGTPAASFRNQVPRKLAMERYERIMAAQHDISLAANKALIGKELDVIIDSVEGRGKALARSGLDAPQIDNQIVLKKVPAGVEPGTFAKAVVRSAKAYDITAEYSAFEEK